MAKKQEYFIGCPDCSTKCKCSKTDKNGTDWYPCKTCEHEFGITDDGDILFK